MSKIRAYLNMVEEKRKTYVPPAKADEQEQEVAYLCGITDSIMSGVMPGAAAIQRREGWSDETVVCYLNGVGDGIAGCPA